MTMVVQGWFGIKFVGALEAGPRGDELRSDGQNGSQRKKKEGRLDAGVHCGVCQFPSFGYL